MYRFNIVINILFLFIYFKLYLLKTHLFFILYHALQGLSIIPLVLQVLTNTVQYKYTILRRSL